MKSTYHIYGIGNALVDIVTEVSDDFLDANKIEKGLMTLVDDDRQHQLIKSINLAESNMQCGGSAANTIIAASQFGAKCYYSCKVANDDMGKFYLDDLVKNGVETNLIDGSLAYGVTGKCLVMTTSDAARTMNTYLGITSQFSTSEINENVIRSSDYVYLEGYLVASPTGREAMKFSKLLAEQNNVKVALTFSDPSMVKYFKKEMEDVVGASVDLLFCNEEEAMLFTGTDNLEDARQELKKSARHFAITLGANGAMIFDGDTFIDIEPYKVNAIDTNGAGDMFAGAFLYGITHGHSFADSGKLASLASSKIVTKFGPRLQHFETKQILERLNR